MKHVNDIKDTFDSFIKILKQRKEPAECEGRINSCCESIGEAWYD